MRRDLAKVLFWIAIFAIASTLYSAAIWIVIPELPWWAEYAISVGAVILFAIIAAATYFVHWLYERWFH